MHHVDTVTVDITNGPCNYLTVLGHELGSQIRIVTLGFMAIINSRNNHTSIRFSTRHDGFQDTLEVWRQACTK